MGFSKNSLISIMAAANENVPVQYQIDYKTISKAAYQLESSLENSENLLDALRIFATSYVGPYYNYDLQPQLFSMLPDGHPMGESEPKKKIDWINEYLSESPTIQGLVASIFSCNLDHIQETHAWKRLDILNKSGKINLEFIATIKKLNTEMLDWSEE